MSGFLVLSKMVINTAHVSRIINTTKGYKIYFANRKLDGYWLLGGGSLDTEPEILLVCNETQEKFAKKDYDAVTEWIKNCNKK